jgi:hypothetical protein
VPVLLAKYCSRGHLKASPNFLRASCVEVDETCESMSIVTAIFLCRTSPNRVVDQPA